MKKLFVLFTLIGLVAVTALQPALATPDSLDTDSAAVVDTNAVPADDVADPAPDQVDAPAEPAPVVAPEEELSGLEIIKKNFIDGDARFMALPLICLILGLAFCIERIISLNLATTNVQKLLEGVEGSLKSGDINGAKELTKANRSPIASIFYQGLERVDEGVEIVEKSIVSYGSVQMGRLEKGLVWISLFIALAPMLGFMGTVIGMIGAFNDIEVAGDISPSVVAGGIKVALLTTVFGLIVAIILQIFYNYIISKIDGIVNDMEDSSITFVDILLKTNTVKRG